MAKNKYSDPRYVKKAKSRFKRAYLKKYGEASRGSYSRNNLTGMGDDHYSWERRLPSKGYSSYSKGAAEDKFKRMFEARTSKAGARERIKELTRSKGYIRGGRGGYGINKATAAKRRQSLSNQADRYKRMWATRKTRYGASGRGGGGKRKGGKRGKR